VLRVLVLIPLLLTSITYAQTDWPSKITGHDVSTAPFSDRSKLIDSLHETLIEMEKSAPFKHRVGKSKFVEICTRGGWINSDLPGQSCKFKAINKGCAPDEIRCAPWTGTNRCVSRAESSPLKACLKERKPAEIKNAANFYFPQGAHRIWASNWIAASLYCKAHPKKSQCQELKTAARRVLDYQRSFQSDKEIQPPRKTSSLKKCTPFFVRLFAGPFLGSYATADDCKFDEKSKTFTRKDGTKIKLSFGKHADPGSEARLIEAILNAQATSTDENLVANIHKVVDEYLAHHADALKDIKRQIADIENGNYDWAGVELAPSELDYVYLLRIQGDLVEELLSASNYPENKIHEYKMLVLQAPPEYLNWKNPDKEIPLVALEEERAKARAVDLMYASLEIRRYVVDMLKSRIITKQDFDVLEKALEDSAAGELVSHRKEVQAVIGKLEKAFKVVVQEYMQNADSFAKASHLREYHVANNALKQPGNGIILMGSAHEKGVAKFLLEICRGIAKKPELPPISEFAKSHIQSVEDARFPPTQENELAPAEEPESPARSAR